MRDIKPGDIVVLRSGSPPMVVVRTVMAYDGEVADVTYWSRQTGQVIKDKVAISALVHEGEPQH